MNKDHKEIARICFVKEGKTWKETYKTTDVKEVEKQLLSDIVAKKMHGCTYIKSIKEICNYDGTRTFTIYFNNNTKNVYTVEMH